MPNTPLTVVSELYQNLVKYIELRIAYGVLKAKVGVVNTLSTLATYLPILFTALMFIFLISLAAAWWVGTALNSPAVGFLVVAGVYLLATAVLLILRKRVLQHWERVFEQRLSQTDPAAPNPAPEAAPTPAE
jgi:hypothetical protein